MPDGPECVVPDKDVTAARVQRLAYVPEGVVSWDVEDQVPLLAAAGESLACGVDGPIRSQRAHKRELARVVTDTN